YIFRGVLMGAGSAAVSGSLDYAAESGLYAGVWGTSGDGTSDEYNLYVGFGGESGDFSYDVNVLGYVYPTTKIDLGQFVELTASVGFSGLGLSLTVPVADDKDAMGGEDYLYAKLSYGYDKFGVVIGNQTADAASEYTHVDLSYQYNDNIAFGVSKIVDGDISQRALFQVSYSLPIELYNAYNSPCPRTGCESTLKHLTKGFFYETHYCCG